MGQPISVLQTTAVGDVLMIDTDRSITGQDGSGFASAEEAAGAGTFPGDLAGRIYAADDAVTNVFVASNQVVIERTGGWDDAASDAASSIVANFFVFYAD